MHIRPKLTWFLFMQKHMIEIYGVNMPFLAPPENDLQELLGRWWLFMLNAISLHEIVTKTIIIVNVIWLHSAEFSFISRDPVHLHVMCFR